MPCDAPVTITVFRLGASGICFVYELLRFLIIVPSAASALIRSLDAYPDTGISSAAMIRLTAGIRPSATGRTRRAGRRPNRAHQVAWEADCHRVRKVFQALCRHCPDPT